MVKIKQLQYFIEVNILAIYTFSFLCKDQPQTIIINLKPLEVQYVHIELLKNRAADVFILFNPKPGSYINTH
jgi:hypothetical protein